MSLTKKLLIGSLIGLTLISILSAVVIFINSDHGHVNLETVSIFQLLFSLVVMLTSASAIFFMHKDGELDNKATIAIGAIFVIGLFSLISSSILIHSYTNFWMTFSEGEAAIILPSISGLFTVPAIAATGYIMAKL